MGDAAGGKVPAPRSPLRVDARGVPDAGPTTWRPLRLRRDIFGPSAMRTAWWSADADGGVRPMTFTIPELSLVVLIGPSGCGKSTFARKHFKPTEVLSSDAFRALVSDDENDQSSTDDAFAALHFVAARRLARGEADGGRCDQRPAGGTQAAGCARPRVPRAAGRHRPRPAGARLPRAQSSAA